MDSEETMYDTVSDWLMNLFLHVGVMLAKGVRTPSQN
jgi:hypothetical protein